MASRKATLLVLALAAAIFAGSAQADVPGPITTRVENLLNAAGGTTGMYLKQVGGPVIAAQNENFVYEPASSIKVVVHLYAMQQVALGLPLGTQVPLNTGPAESCPGASGPGTESLSNALQQMMQVSDNARTRELMEYFGVANLNNFAHNTLGLPNTTFATTNPPCNVIGCFANLGNNTFDGNTTTLTELDSLYEGIANGTLLNGTPRDSFYTLMAGKEMFENQGYDFTGIWPKLLAMVDTEKPAGLSASETDDFKDQMTANTKGGSYLLCLNNACNQVREFLSFEGSVVVPQCNAASTSYVWGVFIHGADDLAYTTGDVTPADTAFGNASPEAMREEIRAALATWGACYPPDVTVSTSPASPPAGQGGFHNAPITVNVSATDDSGISNLLCTDNGSPVAVGSQSGSGPRTGSFTVSGDGAHSIACKATDGATPANTGVSATSHNTASFKIDATAPVTTATLVPTQVGAWFSARNVSLAATDGAGSGVASTQYSVDGGPWTTYTGSFLIATGGPHTLQFRSTDVATNLETTESVSWGTDYTVAQQIAGLSGFLASLGIDHGLATDLQNKLDQAASKSKTAQSCQSLAVFLQQVNAQSGKKLTPAQVALLQSVTQITAALGC